MPKDTKSGYVLYDQIIYKDGEGDTRTAAKGEKVEDFGPGEYDRLEKLGAVGGKKASDAAQLSDEERAEQLASVEGQAIADAEAGKPVSG